MSYKIAVASSDGSTIDQHFGKADRFEIFEVLDDGGFRSSEIRAKPAAVLSGETADHKRGTGCGCEGGEADAGIISDCAYVLAAQIGMGALRSLARQGITAFDVDGNPEDAVKKIIEYNIRLGKRKKIKGVE